MFFTTHYRVIRRLRQIAATLFSMELNHLLRELSLHQYLPPHKRLIHSIKKKESETQAKTIREVFEKLGGGFVKLGQLLALRPDLVGPQISKEFENLFQSVPPESWSKIESLIPQRKEYKKIEQSPIAAGSIAQVHAATLKDGTKVALKIKRPDIDEKFADDIAILQLLASRLQSHYHLEVIDPVQIVAEFRRYTLQELDLGHEKKNMTRFAANFAAQKNIHIPKVYEEFSNSSVLVMEYIDGICILDKKVRQPRQVVQTVTHMVFQQLFIDGFFHADLHPGNIFVEKNKRIALLDYGIVGYIDPAQKDQLTHLFISLASGNLDQTADALIDLNTSSKDPHKEILKEGLYYALADYYGEPLKNFKIGKIFNECIETARRAELRIPANIVLFGKSLLTLEGFCRELDPTFNIVEEAKPFLRSQFLHAHSPKRMVRRALDAAGAISEFITLLPKITKETEKKLSILDQRMTDIDQTFHYLSRTIWRVSKLIIYAMLLSALISASATLINLQPTFYNISIYSIASASIGFVLLILIINSIHSDI